jgi:hypothetical protein
MTDDPHQHICTFMGSPSYVRALHRLGKKLGYDPGSYDFATALIDRALVELSLRVTGEKLPERARRPGRPKGSAKAKPATD